MDNFFHHYFLKKGAVLLAVKLMSSALALVFYYVLAKQLGAAQFGLFSLAMTFLLFCSTIAKQGLEQVSIRFIAKSGSANSVAWYVIIIGYAFSSACIIAFIITVLAEVFAVHVFSQDSLVLLTPLVALLSVLQTFTAINSSALKATHFTRCALFISGFVTFVVACCLLIAFPVTTAYQALLYFTYAALISALVSCVMIFFAFKSKGKPDLSTVRLTSRFVELIKVSKYVFVISLMALATSQLSVLILSSYVTLAELGRYSIALKLSLIVSYPLIIMNAITAPQYANLYEQNHLHSFKGLALTSTRLLFCLGSVGVFVLFLSVDTILAYFGEGYAKASLPLKVLLVGQWFNVATGSVVSMLLMAGYEKLHHRNTLIMTSINIISLIIFIPLYGVLAAAIITSVAMALKNLIALFYVNKLIYCKVPAKVSR